MHIHLLYISSALSSSSKSYKAKVGNKDKEVDQEEHGISSKATGIMNGFIYIIFKNLPALSS
jgi:hypothetical protein